jgi:3-isopropylmalate/(R)-2-methylmalate dehydratase large subunit
MAMTIAEKILARTSGKTSVKPGDVVDASPDLIMSHYSTYRVLLVLKKLNIDVSKIKNKAKLRVPLDHRSPAKTADAANAEKISREFALNNGIKFYDLHEGVAHTLMLEHKEVLPGMLVVGTDSHTTIYGAVGAFGTGIGYTEAAYVWLTDKLWLRVPETFKINLKGKSFPKGIYPRDMMTTIIGNLTADGCNYKSVEFYGELVENLTIDDRQTFCCLALEMGAKTAIFPPDNVTKKFLGNVKEKYEIVLADKDAGYARELTYDVNSIEPVVSIPHDVDKVVPISKVGHVKVDQAFVGSCANGAIEDMEIVAKILKGKKIAPHVRFLVAPASKDVFQKIIANGTLAQMVDAGVILINPGCGACSEDVGSLADGEVCLSSSTRNFLARMGNPKSEIYLGSPATVAASAIKGEIADPREFL